MQKPDNTTEQELVIYNWEPKIKRLKVPVSIKGEETSIFHYNEVTEFLNMNTGEILQAQEINIPSIDYSVRVLQRQSVLQTLRPEVRDVAMFVLKFRNKRRAITPALDDVLVWYADLHNKRRDNVKRHKDQLLSTILVNDSLLQPLFQIMDKQATASDHAAEDIIASNVLLDVSRRLQNNT